MGRGIPVMRKSKPQSILEPSFLAFRLRDPSTSLGEARREVLPPATQKYIRNRKSSCMILVECLLLGGYRIPMKSSSHQSYFFYIFSSHCGVLYIGMTNNLKRRLEEHRTLLGSRFSSKYRVTRLVYWEEFQEVEETRRREKQIKSWRRSKKLALVRRLNPTFRDLSADLAI